MSGNRDTDLEYIARNSISGNGSYSERIFGNSGSHLGHISGNSGGHEDAFLAMVRSTLRMRA